MEDSHVEGNASSQVAELQNEQTSVSDTAMGRSIVGDPLTKAPHNSAIQPKTPDPPHATQKSQSQNTSNGVKTTDSASPVTVQPSTESLKPNKPITKTPSQPIVMPKHINTPDGTILLNTNSPIGKPPAVAKPKKAIETASKHVTAGSKASSKQPGNSADGPSVIKSRNSPQVSRTTTTPTQPSPSTPQMSRSSSVQPIVKVATPYQTMQRTSSVPVAKNSPVSAPVTKPSTSNQSHPAPSVYFHPIAIKPKPIQPLPSKSRSKSSSLSRLNSGSTIHSSKDQVKSSDSSITLTTSRNWILPPRPKTKKASKKKEKRPVQKATSASGTDLKNATSVSQKSSTPAFSSKTMPKKAMSPTSYSQKTAVKDLSTPSNSKVKLEKETSLVADANKLKVASTHDIIPNGSTKPARGEGKQKECTGCTTCVAPGTRSVYLEPSTGKVSINAQIHSNINLYTNDQGELEVQLQHVTRENDNLKKILLKLNKEIQNLKIVKKKEESSLLNNTGTGTGTSGMRSVNSKSTVVSNVKIEPSESNATSMYQTKPQTSGSKLSSDPKKLERELPLKIKQESMDMEMDVDEDLSAASGGKVEISSNDDKLLFNKLTASTIDPVNLSYNLESKRQKVANSISEEISTKSIRPSLVQQPSDLSMETLAAPKAKSKKRTEKTTTGNTKSKAKPKALAKSKSMGNATQKLNSDSPQSSPNNTLATSSTINTSTKSIDPVKKPDSSKVKKEYHSCGVCEIGQKCVCFETQTLSIAATIAQALSRGGVNLLGLGGMNNTSINTLNNMSNVNGLSTLTAILKREEIMKKLKDDDKKTLTNILKSESTKKGTSKKEKANLNTILGGLNGLPMDDNICGMNTMNDASMTDMRNDLVKTSSLTPVAGNDDDDELLQMIDAELLLDPTPLVNPILLKKDKAGTSSTNISALKINATDSSHADAESSGMKRSESRNSQHSLGTNTEFFGRGSLMDFNAFNGGELMIDDDTMMFEGNSLSMGNANGDMSTDIDKILMEPIDDTDEFMIY